jgi:hypothetical protein
MEIPKRNVWPWIGSLLAAALTVYELPSLIHDFEGWRNAGPTVRHMIPLSTALYIIVGLILVSWGPTLWRWFRGHRYRAGRAAHADALEARLTELVAENAGLKQQLTEEQETSTRLRGMVDHARKERDEAQAGFDRYKDIAWQLSSVLDYGEEFPKYGELGSQDKEAVVLKVWDLYRPWEAAIDSARELWGVLGDTARKGDERSLGAQLWKRIDHREHGRVERALGRLKESLEQKWDPRPPLARLYTCYWDWRDAMRALAAKLPGTVPSGPHDEALDAAYRRLREELEGKLQLPLLRLVKMTMDGYDEDRQRSLSPSGTLRWFR